MDALPLIELSWDESAEPLTSFLRYNVWRREEEEGGEYTRLAVIGDRSLTSYQDTTPSSGVTYEYNVTVVASDTAGEEIESDYADPVTGAYTLRSHWFHVVGEPSVYAQVQDEGSTHSHEQDMVLVQRWGARLPTAHFGPQAGQVVEMSLRTAWETESDVWEALRAIQEAQAASGVLVCLRGYRDATMFGVVGPLPRQDELGGLYAVSVVFIANEHEEAV